MLNSGSGVAALIMVVSCAFCFQSNSMQKFSGFSRTEDCRPVAVLQRMFATYHWVQVYVQLIMLEENELEHVLILSKFCSGLLNPVQVLSKFCLSSV